MANGGDTSGSPLLIAKACNIYAHSGGNVFQTPCGNLSIELLHVRQQHGVTHAMWQVVEATQLVRHSVHITQ
ncbi:hypothetical protein D3C81_2263160 [compost metagenome]